MPESDVRKALGALELFEGAPPAVLERLAGGRASVQPCRRRVPLPRRRPGRSHQPARKRQHGGDHAAARRARGRDRASGPRRPDRRDGDAGRASAAALGARHRGQRWLELRCRRHRPARSYGAARGHAAAGAPGARAPARAVRASRRALRRGPARGRVLALCRARRRGPGGGGGARARGDRLPGDRALLQPLQRLPRSRSCSATCAGWRHRAAPRWSQPPSRGRPS